MELLRIFPTDKAAEQCLAERRRPSWVACLKCRSVNVQTGAEYRTMPFGWRDCRSRFSVR